MTRRTETLKGLILLILASSLTVLVHCVNEPDNRSSLNYSVETGAVDEKVVLAAAIRNQITAQSVTYSEADTGFIIDGDGFMPLKDAMDRYGYLLDTAKAGAANAATAMFGYYPLAKSKREIRLYCYPTVPEVWQWALDSAIRYFNDSVDCGIRYVRQANLTSTVTTKVIVGAYPVGTVALSAYPDFYGNPGNSVKINSYYTGQDRLDSMWKVMAIAHELGHTVGFGHTDGTYGKLVEGTAADPASVMHSRVMRWQGFTQFDKKAFRVTYPKLY